MPTEEPSSEQPVDRQWRQRFRNLAPTGRKLLRWAVRSYLVMIVVGVVLGLQIAPAVTQFTADPVEGKVAVIPIEGGIDGGNADSVVTRLERARQDPSIEAVVLRINSGGGGAAASEDMYTAVKRTAEQMPVVVSVNALAASGAYYTAAPADVIYVKPASLVGSVGVRFIAPVDVPPIDIRIKTGPNKLTGGDKRDWIYSIESVKRAFLNAVVENRKPKGLKLSRTQVANAKLYSGAEAVSNGLADRIGSTEDAIKHAANLADLTRHRVEILGYSGSVGFVTKTAFEASSVENKTLVEPETMIQDPADVTVPQIVMLPPGVVREALEAHLENSSSVLRTPDTRAVTPTPTEVTPHETSTG